MSNGLLIDEQLHKPDTIVEGFGMVWIIDQQLDRDGWQYLWRRYGLAKLIEIARRSGWLEASSNEEAARQLIERSLDAGYDPVSGLFGELEPRTRQFVAADSDC